MSTAIEQHITRALVALEAERRLALAAVTRHYVVTALVALAGLGFVLLVGFFRPKFGLQPSLAWPFVVVTIAFAGVFKPKAQRDFVTRFKRHIVRAVVKQIDPGLEFHPDAGVAIDEFLRLGVLPEAPSRSSSEDMIQGTLGGIPLEASEAHLERRETHTVNGRTRTRYVTIFRGHLLRVRFNKPVKGVTLALPDVAERAMSAVGLGSIGRFLQRVAASSAGDGLGLKAMRLDDPEFEKHFSVYGSDPVEARYVLTPTFMQRLVAIGPAVGRDVRVGVAEGIFYAAIPDAYDRYEVSLRQPLDRTVVARVYEELAAVLVLVGDLKLNERLWQAAGEHPRGEAAAPPSGYVPLRPRNIA